MNSSKSFVDNIVTLDFDDYNDDDENYDEENNEEGSVPINDVKYSYGTMCAIVKYSKTPTFQSLRHRYRHVKHKEQLRRIKELLLPVHDCDVRRLAMKKARGLNLPGFAASHHWLSDFKHLHHISSRKITKLVTKHYIDDREIILMLAENILIKVKEKQWKYATGHILNSDQRFQVTTIAEASKIGHIFVTATGSTELIRGEHILEMRDMAILCNIGSGQTEIDVAWLKVNATKIENLKPHVDIYHLPNGRAIILPADGRVINLSCAHGNPSFVMSNSFSNQILAQIELYTKKGHYPVGIHILPKTLDEEVAMAHLEYLGIKLDKLTVNQSAYIDVHPDGPFKPIYYRY
ncbi:unnamed protein product [Rotaria magnacalcarata]|uniref:S-adenosyl-L-homocysteine hydrolase NAD binding domain-containing protein n=1 Tax=Rotaria magnacalcarata TaxID=392030 RepID=A0A816WV47_9BILA|nr:unnamed protein product [Rotaria magnacalcarata]